MEWKNISIMKRISVLFCIIFCVLIAYPKKDARADIYFANGATLENIELKFPGSWYEKVEYFVGGKKKHIHADSIDHILLYHIDFPENKAYLRWNPIGSYDLKK